VMGILEDGGLIPHVRTKLGIGRPESNYL
jgi:hypothetical protein